MASDKQLRQSEAPSLLRCDDDRSQPSQRARHDQDNDNDCRRIICRLDQTLNIETLRSKDSATLDAYYSELSHILNKIKQVKEEVQQEAIQGKNVVSNKSINNEILSSEPICAEKHRQQEQEQQQKTQALNIDHNVQPRSKLGDVLSNTGNDILFQVLGFLDVIAVDKKQVVCKQWRDCCEKVIDSRGRVIKKAFECNDELHRTVRKYVEGDIDDIETIAGEYGYPIGKWNVSQITDFSFVFHEVDMNEDVSQWNVANAVAMMCVFASNSTFNQDLSSWDTSNVTDMSAMFLEATMFNQDLSSWDVSRVSNMASMFTYATAFNQDISSWDVSNVKDATNMFYHAESFNQDLTSWEFSEYCDCGDMFRGATSYRGATRLSRHRRIEL